jgi:hypothetical protein
LQYRKNGDGSNEFSVMLDTIGQRGKATSGKRNVVAERRPPENQHNLVALTKSLHGIEPMASTLVEA